MKRLVILCAGVLCLVPVTAAGQATGPSLFGYGTLGSTALAAAETFEAVAGTSRRTNLGGGAHATIWRGLFVDGAVSRLRLTGERVFIHGETVYQLGVPLTVTLRPVDVAAGWRIRRGRVSPFAGGGLSMVSYAEESDFAEAGDDVRETRTGAMFLGGVDVAVLQWLQLGGELRYRAVTGVLGAGGVSGVFGEDSIGGVAASVRVSVGR